MKKILLFLLLASALFIAGCKLYNDPSPDELKIAENIDIERMQGTVIAMSVQYFEGDRDDTKDKKGTPYYCITFSIPQEGETDIIKEFRGVSTRVFDALAVGMQLPQAPLLSFQELARMEGRIADKIPFPEKNKFFIVVDDYAAVKLYRVEMATYYHRKISIGARLPMSPDDEGEDEGKEASKEK